MKNSKKLNLEWIPNAYTKSIDTPADKPTFLTALPVKDYGLYTANKKSTKNKKSKR